MIFGLTTRDVVTLVREAGSPATPLPIHVWGDGAPSLAAALAADGAASLVRVAPGSEDASALVVLARDPGAVPMRTLRGAARAGVPVVAVLSDPGRVPYVLAENVVPAAAEPLASVVADRLAAEIGGAAAPLAHELPVLRDAVARREERRGAVTAAWVAGLDAGGAPRLPLLALLQARLLRRLAIARGSATPRGTEAVGGTVGVELGAALTTGLVARAVARRLPRRRPVEAAVAYVATRLLVRARRVI